MDEKINAKVIIEMLGAPKEHIVDTMKLLIEKISSDDKLKLIGYETPDPIEKDRLWSLFTEAEIQVENASELMGFCFDYMPSSVDIISPDSLKFDSTDFADLINDIQARLHEVDMIMKGVNAENKLLKRNGTILLQNNILMQLKSEEKNLDELSKDAGIAGEQLEKFLDFLEKNNRVKKINGKYSLNNG